jgi:hypothetical protein
MVSKPRRVRPTKPKTTPPPPRKFVVWPASVVKFRHIEGMDGTLYGLDEEGQVFAYVPTSEAWVRLDGDDNRVVFLRTPEDEPAIDESRFPEEIQKERAARAEKTEGREAWYLVHERVHEAIEMHAGWRISHLDQKLDRVLKALEKKETPDGEAK